MRVRNGFVSNSSSSSFIIEVKDWDDNFLITQDKIDLLLSEDFNWVETNSPNILETSGKNKKKKIPEKYKFHLGKCVICNQDDEIDFLIKNKIPFKGCCHYGHETVIFDGKKLYTIKNPGLVAETYGIKYLDLKKLKKEKLVTVEIIK